MCVCVCVCVCVSTRVRQGHKSRSLVQHGDQTRIEGQARAKYKGIKTMRLIKAEENSGSGDKNRGGRSGLPPQQWGEVRGESLVWIGESLTPFVSPRW